LEWQPYYGVTPITGFKVDGVDYHTSADLTGQANHLRVTIQADIIKQKLPTNNGGYLATKHGKTNKLVYEQLTSEHPIDLTRYQLLNCYNGRIGLINCGGESLGDNDLQQAVTTGVVNKRAGGMGLILSRKASSDFDVDFANMMVEHHQGGIDIAQVEVSQGKDEKMKTKAQESPYKAEKGTAGVERLCTKLQTIRHEAW